MTIKEVKKDLFTMPNDYALAHCISADFALGAGIAKEFDKRLNARQKLFQVFPNSWAYRWDKTKEKYRAVQLYYLAIIRFLTLLLNATIGTSPH